jgi:hypothetical protein
MGEGHIGIATFEELKGRDLIVQGLVPELYRREFMEKYPGSDRRSGGIVGFVKSKIGHRQLAPKERLLVREYLLNYLMGDPTGVMKVLFEFFISLEGFLRNNSQAYVGRLCQDNFDEIFSLVGAKEKEQRKYLSLGKLLELYERAMKASKSGKINISISKPQELVQLRNETQHGALMIADESWSRPLEIVLDSYQSVQELVSIVSSLVSTTPNARYF